MLRTCSLIPNLFLLLPALIGHTKVVKHLKKSTEYGHITLQVMSGKVSLSEMTRCALSLLKDMIPSRADSSKISPHSGYDIY